MARFTIGIDTGGTYTDAVILDADNHGILASAKALTTRGNLLLGVVAALDEVLLLAGHDFQRGEISRVCLSTTLATNALVEGQGNSVTAFLLGFDAGMIERSGISEAVPNALIIAVAGGHRYDGSELCGLDEDAILRALDGDAGHSASFAVASVYSVRNPGHERRVAQLIREKTGRPVSVSCDLSDTLHGPRRALTAVFNARIVSLIAELQNSVEQALGEHGIDASLMIVKGDGSVAPAHAVASRPVETILSGPAASVIGAGYLTGLRDFVVADMGGTTLDVAKVKDGWPALKDEGSDVGGYRTLVRAIDMRTLGLGGDSGITAHYGGKIELGTRRVVSLSLLADRWPHILGDFRNALLDDTAYLDAIRYLVLPEGQSDERLPDDLKAVDRDFLEKLHAANPAPYNQFIEGASDRVRLGRLLNRGLVQVSGLTPSDAAHVLGLQTQWCTEGARLGCELVGRGSGRLYGRDTTAQLLEFAEEIFSTVAASAAQVMLEQCAGGIGAGSGELVAAVTEKRHRLGDLLVSLKPAIPMVAVGGPAGVFFPEIAERLQCDVIIPDSSGVANAVGAAAGLYRARAVVEVTRCEKNGYVVHTSDGPETWEQGVAALQRAEASVREHIQASLLELGGREGKLTVDVERVDIPDLEEEFSLVSARVTAEAFGYPN